MQNNDYRIKGDNYGYINDNGKFKPIGKAIFIDRILKSLETEEIHFDIRFLYRDEWVELTVPRSTLQRNKLIELQAKGADLTEKHVGIVAELLRQQEKQAIINYTHNGIGWFDYKGKKHFRSNEVEQYKSEYRGTLPIIPTGSMDSWKQMVGQYVLGTPLEIAIVAGLSAPVVGFVRDKLNMDNILFHVFGESTTGKTTFLQLAVSTGSHAIVSNDSLCQTWNCTENAMLHKLVGNCGYPVGFDELSVSTTTDFSKAIYSLANGQSKLRMNSNLQFEPSSSFKTTIISTGECSILDQSSRNTGLYVRMIEFPNICWTKSAEAANAIKEAVFNNYGHPVKQMVSVLYHMGQEKVVEMCNEGKKYFLQAIGNSEFSNRMSAKYGLLLATAKLAKSELGIRLNYKYIKNFFVSNYSQNAPTSIGVRAYEYFRECCTNNSLFPDFNDVNELTDVILGCTRTLKSKEYCSICKKHYQKELMIPKENFAELLDKGGFKDANVVLADLKRNGLLNYESERYTRKRKFPPDNQERLVYVIKLF